MQNVGAPPPTHVPLFCSFLSFAKPTVNIKLPKPQSERVRGFWGGKSTFFKHMHFQFLFCSVIKSSICTNHRGCLRPLVSLRPTYLHTPLLSLTQPIALYNQPGRHVLTKYHETDQISLFTFTFYCRRVNNQVQAIFNDTLVISKQMYQFEFG